jgi:hypothetical protein
MRPCPFLPASGTFFGLTSCPLPLPSTSTVAMYNPFFD